MSRPRVRVPRTSTRTNELRAVKLSVRTLKPLYHVREHPVLPHSKLFYPQYALLPASHFPVTFMVQDIFHGAVVLVASGGFCLVITVFFVNE